MGEAKTIVRIESLLNLNPLIGFLTVQLLALSLIIQKLSFPSILKVKLFQVLQSWKFFMSVKALQNGF